MGHFRACNNKLLEFEIGSVPICKIVNWQGNARLLQNSGMQGSVFKEWDKNVRAFSQQLILLPLKETNFLEIPYYRKYKKQKSWGHATTFQICMFQCFTFTCAEKMQGSWEEIPWSLVHGGLCLDSVSSVWRLYTVFSILSRASAHGRSQLKRQNLGVGSYTEKVVKWFNYPQAKAHPRCEASCHVAELNSLLVCLYFVEASPTAEKTVSCYKADWLVASLLSFRSIQSSSLSRRLQYVNFMLQGRNTANEAMDRCVQTWCRAPKAHQNNRSYVSSEDLPSDSLCKNLAWRMVARITQKNHKTVKIGGWVLARVWALARDNTVVAVLTHFPSHCCPCFIRCSAWYVLG